MSLFYKLTSDTAAELISAKLPSSSWKLWTWLTTLDPFADRQVQITWEKAKEAINISKPTFYRALARLVNAGLLVSQKISCFGVSLKNETTFSELTPESQNCDFQSQNCDSSLIYRLTDLSDSLRRGKREKNGKSTGTGQQDSKPTLPRPSKG